VLPTPYALPLLAQLVHTPHPFLIQFGENFGIRYYGLAYLLGFVAAAWLLHRYHRAGRSPVGPDAIWDLMTWLIAGVLVGGRLGFFLFYQPGTLLTEPLAIFKVWDGGMASHGGFLGVTLALFLFARRHRVNFLHLSDLIVSTAPLGLGLGRLANFLNGELWGKATDVPWAVIFSATGGGNVPRHPSQLYEAALEGFLLFAFLQWRFWRGAASPQTMGPQDQEARAAKAPRPTIFKLQPGRLSGEFLLGYALARIVCEFFREPDAALILGLSRGTFYSVFLAMAGVALVIMSNRRRGSTGSV
jgi:phosphatidylglycerol---prolipoprotein diacylglyceryl transferase